MIRDCGRYGLVDQNPEDGSYRFLELEPDPEPKPVCWACGSDNLISDPPRCGDCGELQ